MWASLEDTVTSSWTFIGQDREATGATTSSSATESTATAEEDEEQSRRKKKKKSKQTRRKEELQAFTSLFVAKPKDFVAGTGNGLAMVFGGAAAGVGAMLALPVLGAQQGGIGGGAAGATAGVCVGAALPVYGALAGAAQILGGVLNTPRTISGTISGQQWDEVRRETLAVSLSMCVVICLCD